MTPYQRMLLEHKGACEKWRAKYPGQPLPASLLQQAENIKRNESYEDGDLP